MSAGLLRVTAVAGGRRSDLAVPGDVAVAELVPDVARAVGLLDPAAVYAGYRLHAHGRRLQPDRGLCEQGVGDGALLAVTAGVDEAEPLIHDDLAEAAADAAAQLPAWAPEHTRRTTLLAGVVATVVGLGALAHDLGPSIPPGWSVPAAVVLALTVLAGNAAPGLAVDLGVGRTDETPIDRGRLESMVTRSTLLVQAGSVAVGLVLVLTAPVVAADPVGAVLAADCCAVALLRARRLRGRASVLVVVAGGLGGLLSTVGALLVRDPASRPVVATALVVTGLVGCVLTRVPGPPVLLRARLCDLLETMALVALAPLVLVATDGLARF